MPKSKSEHCQCWPRGSWGTCGHCLANAPPYFYTLDSGERVYETRPQGTRTTYHTHTRVDPVTGRYEDYTTDQE